MRIPVALLATCLLPAVALAQQPIKPTLSAKSRSIEIAVKIDAALRDYKRLHEYILADAKRMIEKRRKEADAEYRTDRLMFRHGPWNFERGYFFNAATGPYVSVSVLDYSYAGGAHPNHRTTAILWNHDRNSRVSVGELFRETKPGGPTMTALARSIREEIAKEKRERDVEVADPPEKDHYLSEIKADLTKVGQPSLVSSTVAGKVAGIDFHFSAYDVGAYAEGDYGAYLPWQILEPFLTSEARALFAGERRELGREKN